MNTKQEIKTNDEQIQRGVGVIMCIMLFVAICTSIGLGMFFGAWLGWLVLGAFGIVLVLVISNGMKKTMKSIADSGKKEI